MKPVLILEHQIPENIAYLGTWLTNNKVDYVVYNAEKDKMFPNSIEPYSALAVMGGAMSANDPLHTNRQAEILILQAILNDIPVIGHCLGGQLISKALGGRVTYNSVPEIGWQEIQYVDNFLVEKWFGPDPTESVIHWHYDCFTIPRGATLLASTKNCPHQAFAYGKHLAMQFHIEIDETKLNFWVTDKDENWIKAQKNFASVQSKEQMLEGAKRHLLKHQKTADRIYNTWLETTGLLG